MAKVVRARKKRIIDERTSGRDDHRTPAWFIARVVKFRSIGLDPAGSPKKNTPASVARVIFLLKRKVDGLTQSWRRHGLVFCNPPYGREVAKWSRKAVEEFGLGATGSDELIMLVAARVDTRWFKRMWRHSSAVLLCNSRFQFIGEKDCAKFPQAVLYFGQRSDRFTKHFGDLGLIIESGRPKNERALTVRLASLHFPAEQAA